MVFHWYKLSTPIWLYTSMYAWDLRRLKIMLAQIMLNKIVYSGVQRALTLYASLLFNHSDEVSGSSHGQRRRWLSYLARLKVSLCRKIKLHFKGLKFVREFCLKPNPTGSEKGKEERCIHNCGKWESQTSGQLILFINWKTQNFSWLYKTHALICLDFLIRNQHKTNGLFNLYLKTKMPQ